MNNQKLIKECKRLENIIKSYKWKWRDGRVLKPGEVNLTLHVYGLVPAYKNNKGFKKTYDAYLNYLKDVCNKTNITYQK